MLPRRLTSDLPAVNVAALARAVRRGEAGRVSLDAAGRLDLGGGVALELRPAPMRQGGWRPLAACPGCGRRAALLYLDAPGLRCRRCAVLVHPSTRCRTAERVPLLAAARLDRARAALDPGPHRMPASTWARRLEELRAAELAVQAALDAAVQGARGRLAAMAAG